MGDRRGLIKESMSINDAVVRFFFFLVVISPHHQQERGCTMSIVSDRRMSTAQAHGAVKCSIRE